ncbi:MAG: hypothetical protein NTW32_25630 [Chloroflexi bacterium]|nr:hypothetical protein [Chloroflexota bacterium]
MRRSTVILILIFVILGTFAWYMQQPDNAFQNILSTSSTSIPSMETGALITPDKGPISLLSIRNSAGKTITIAKENGQWLVKGDISGPADESLAESAVGQLLTLRIIKKLETIPDSIGTGLNNPLFFISCKLADSSIFSIKLGKETVTGSGYYVEAPNNMIYIISKSEVDSLILNFSEPPLLK